MNKFGRFYIFNSGRFKIFEFEFLHSHQVAQGMVYYKNNSCTYAAFLYYGISIPKLSHETYPRNLPMKPFPGHKWDIRNNLLKTYNFSS